MKPNRHRRLIVLLGAGLLLTPWTAQGAEKKAEGPPASQYIDISSVPLPVVKDGRLINYIFVAVRVNLKPGANAMKLREKEPYLRDALVRAAHAQPFTLATSYTKLDEDKMRAAVDASARRLLGPANVMGIVISSQTPKQTIGLPRIPAAH